MSKPFFLSHLSGDEVEASLVLKHFTFLSHLSGDEAYDDRSSRRS